MLAMIAGPHSPRRKPQVNAMDQVFGTYTTAPFVHDHWEEVYVVSGDLIVGNDAQGQGGESFEAPTYACRPPGVHHGPFKSERGCLLYEIHYYDESGKSPP